MCLGDWRKDTPERQNFDLNDYGEEHHARWRHTCARDTHNFSRVASESVVAFSSLRTPQLAGFVKRSSGNFVPERNSASSCVTKELVEISDDVVGNNQTQRTRKDCWMRWRKQHYDGLQVCAVLRQKPCPKLYRFCRNFQWWSCCERRNHQPSNVPPNEEYIEDAEMSQHSVNQNSFTELQNPYQKVTFPTQVIWQSSSGRQAGTLKRLISPVSLKTSIHKTVTLSPRPRLVEGNISERKNMRS